MDYKELKPLIDFIKKQEGGYANHPLDHGGPTNKGITIATYRACFGQNKTVTDLKNLTDEEWFIVFKKLFWDKIKADKILSKKVSFVFADYVWASGTNAIKRVQRLVGVTPDGIVGDKTIKAINMLHGDLLSETICKDRDKFHSRIVENNHSQRVFLKGWNNRVNNLRKLIRGL